MATEPMDEAVEAAPEWQRISPVAVLDMVVTAIRKGAIQALPG